MRVSSVLLFIAVSLRLYAVSLDDVVKNSYPADLAAAATLHHYEEQRQQTYVEIATKTAGYVVAAYSNGEIGAVVLLEKSGDGYRVDQEVSRESGQFVGGKDPEITPIDVDGDGIPEVVVRFVVGMTNSDQAWVFRISSGHLQLISPTTKRGLSLLGYGHFLDLTGSGLLDIVDDAATKDGTKYNFSHPRYVLHNGSYVAADPIDYYEVFFREDGAPTPVTRSLSVPATSLQKGAKLVIVNGDALGAPYRVSAGRITLNGVVVSPEQDFSQQRGTWVVPATLLQQNTLAVWLDGKPASRIAVVIRHE